MADQVTIAGRVLTLRCLSGEWGVAEVETDDTIVRCTGDVAHLSVGDVVQALGRFKETRWGREFTARAILPDSLMDALAEIEAVTDRFQPRKPARGAVLGLVIRLGTDAAKTMKRNPFLPVVDEEHQAKGWGYGSAAQYADLVGIPADAEVRATAAVQHLWQHLADGSVVVSRDKLESRIATAAGIDAGAASRWVDVVIKDGRLEPMGPQVAWRDDANAERAIARILKERMAA